MHKPINSFYPVVSGNTISLAPTIYLIHTCIKTRKQKETHAPELQSHHPSPRLSLENPIKSEEHILFLDEFLCMERISTEEKNHLMNILWCGHPQITAWTNHL